VPQFVSKLPQKKRRKSRPKQRLKVVKSLWRFGCMSAIFGGVGWVASYSDWKISKAEQIHVQGNQYLTDQAVRSILAIPYPKLIMELAPAQLTAKLIAQGSISTAKIDRSLLPPHLTVQVQDLPPIARIIPGDDTLSQMFIDERGRQLPLSSYRPAIWPSLPTLQLKLPTTGICPDWPQLYPIVHTSPVAVSVVDCRNPQNLFLQTEIGAVRLGAVGANSRSKARIQELDRLRDWQKYTDPTTVEYIDLENPDSPKLQLKPGKTQIEPVMAPKQG
jgi:cell division protein FtsQ